MEIQSNHSEYCISGWAKWYTSWHESLFVLDTFFLLIVWFFLLLEQVVKKVEVRIQTFEDSWALRLTNFIVGANQLMFDGLTREIPMWVWSLLLWFLFVLHSQISDCFLLSCLHTIKCVSYWTSLWLYIMNMQMEQGCLWEVCKWWWCSSIFLPFFMLICLPLKHVFLKYLLVFPFQFDANWFKDVWRGRICSRTLWWMLGELCFLIFFDIRPPLFIWREN